MKRTASRDSLGLVRKGSLEDILCLVEENRTESMDDLASLGGIPRNDSFSDLQQHHQKPPPNLLSTFFRTQQMSRDLQSSKSTFDDSTNRSVSLTLGAFSAPDFGRSLKAESEAGISAIPRVPSLSDFALDELSQQDASQDSAEMHANQMMSKQFSMESSLHKHGALAFPGAMGQQLQHQPMQKYPPAKMPSKKLTMSSSDLTSDLIDAQNILELSKPEGGQPGNGMMDPPTTQIAATHAQPPPAAPTTAAFPPPQYLQQMQMQMAQQGLPNVNTSQMGLMYGTDVAAASQQSYAMQSYAGLFPQQGGGDLSNSSSAEDLNGEAADGVYTEGGYSGERVYNERGYEICGVLNQHHKPCQRIGRCPFHSGRGGANTPGGTMGGVGVPAGGNPFSSAPATPMAGPTSALPFLGAVGQPMVLYPPAQQQQQQQQQQPQAPQTPSFTMPQSRPVPAAPPPPARSTSPKPMKQGPYKTGWSKEEHLRFLHGLQMYEKGDWKSIAEVVGTRSSSQVQSHAQKYFLRLKQDRKHKRSIHDYTIEELEASLSPSRRATYMNVVNSSNGSSGGVGSGGGSGSGTSPNSGPQPVAPQTRSRAAAARGSGEGTTKPASSSSASGNFSSPQSNVVLQPQGPVQTPGGQDHSSMGMQPATAPTLPTFAGGSQVLVTIVDPKTGIPTSVLIPSAALQFSSPLPIQLPPYTTATPGAPMTPHFLPTSVQIPASHPQSNYFLAPKPLITASGIPQPAAMKQTPPIAAAPPPTPPQPLYAEYQNQLNSVVIKAEPGANPVGPITGHHAAQQSSIVSKPMVAPSVEGTQQHQPQQQSHPSIQAPTPSQPPIIATAPSALPASTSTSGGGSAPVKHRAEVPSAHTLTLSTDFEVELVESQSQSQEHSFAGQANRLSPSGAKATTSGSSTAPTSTSLTPPRPPATPAPVTSVSAVNVASGKPSPATSQPAGGASLRDIFLAQLMKQQRQQTAGGSLHVVPDPVLASIVSEMSSPEIKSILEQTSSVPLENILGEKLIPPSAVPPQPRSLLHANAALRPASPVSSLFSSPMLHSDALANGGARPHGNHHQHHAHVTLSTPEAPSDFGSGERQRTLTSVPSYGSLTNWFSQSTGISLFSRSLSNLSDLLDANDNEGAANNRTDGEPHVGQKRGREEDESDGNPDVKRHS